MVETATGPITYPTLSHQPQSNLPSSGTVGRNNPFVDDSGSASTNSTAAMTGNPSLNPPYALHNEPAGPQGDGYSGPAATAGRTEGYNTASPASGITAPEHYGKGPAFQNVIPPASTPRPPQNRGFSTSSEGHAFGGGFDPRFPAARSNSQTHLENTGPGYSAAGNSATPIYAQHSRASVDAPGTSRASVSTPSFIPPNPAQSQPVAKKYIYFYNRDEPYYEFTNFSPDPVVFEDKEYPTSEHLFQAMKFLPRRPLLAEHIRTYSNNPRDAFTEARRFQPEWDPNWHTVKIDRMDQVLELKFMSTKRLLNLLTRTGDAILVEDSPVDDFWGIGANRQGKNELGNALMRVRKKLQDMPAPQASSGWGINRFWSNT